MRSSRTEKLRPTAFDMVAAALSPALIIGMIGSLVFFLVIAFYRGEYDTRLMYILGLFTLATVLIARIAIESGRAHANLFALPLAIAALVAMFRFVTIPGGLEIVGWLMNVGLLALVWYLADRITFDCTLVEEDRESVQGGLLQTLGVPERSGAQTDSVPKSAPVVSTKKSSKHNPGVWVLYFALLAFPLFGLGQLAIPDAAQRSTAFWLLVMYLGCALGLLTTTALLALRRYLRQRGVEMPVEITARWLASGIGLAIAVLLLCMLLPLPGRSLGLIGLPFEITSPENLTTSRFGTGNDGQQTEPHGVPRADQQDSEQDAAAQADQGASSGQEKNGNKTQPARECQQRQQDQQGQPGQDQPGQDQSDNGQSQSDKSDRPSNPKPDDQSPADQSKRSDRAKPSEDQRDQAAIRQSPKPKHEHEQEQEQEQDATRSQTAEGQPARPTPADKKMEQPKQTEQAHSSPASSSNYNFAQRLGDLGNWLGQWFKWLTIVILAMIVVLYAVFHPNEIANLWRSLLDFLAVLFGGKRSGRQQTSLTADTAANAARTRPRFSAFANPFAQNLRGWQAVQVVEHTFAALEAWAAEHGHARDVDQTAEEFAKRLAADIPRLVKLPIIAAGMLDRVMFAGWQPTPSDLAPLADLWRRLQSLEFLSPQDAEIAKIQ